MKDVAILGAGITGCLAGMMLPEAIILEASPEFHQNHHALLRFRSDELSRVTAIPFKRVKVYKSIWYQGHHLLQADPQLANWYSRKCTGEYLSRSIWDTEPSVRWIAPSDFHEQLATRCGHRIKYGVFVDCLPPQSTIISTLPMPVLAGILGDDLETAVQFKHTPIQVERCLIRGADIHQTIYYPDPSMSVYRASIVGDRMIIEAAGTMSINESDIIEVAASFGASMGDFYDRKAERQEYGKIVPIDNAIRKQFIFRASLDHRVFSLGRYATWKDVLLDEVYGDLSKVREMMDQSDYDLRRSGL